ncbi:MFS transporter [Dactylosporangium vinaceum]|uniref:MFS transporter n=1 Tax=Dactylosporangium vinaceum TaxID=53362 RepID=A0ABV5M4C5_9ACTN|nr:MFS transporter [Dactylosporangium vinaceum]UAB93402.1 MFS transporter [Dactylosporangium vinaceum]
MGWPVARVLGDRNARLYLGGVFVSGFGDSAMSLAAGVWVKTRTGSDALAGVVAAGMWFALLLGPLLGGVADRVDRRRLLVAVNLVLAAVMVAVAAGPVWLLFGALSLVGVGAVLLEAAEAALLPSVVGPELRGDFNGLTRTVTEGMKLFAPAAGAALFTLLGGPSVALLNAATLAVAAVAFARLRPAPGRPAAPEGAATTPVLRDRELRVLILAGAATMVVASLSSSATYALLDALHRPPAFAGVLTPAQGLGSVAGGLLAGALMRRLGERGYSAAGLALVAAGAALRATPWTTTVIVGCVLMGLGLPAPLIAAVTAVQRVIPPQRLGRAAATANSVIFVPAGPALILGGFAVALADYRVQTLAAAGLAALAAVTVAVSGAARRR